MLQNAGPAPPADEGAPPVKARDVQEETADTYEHRDDESRLRSKAQPARNG